MNKRKSHFRFNKQERSGIFFLLSLIALLQGVYFFAKAQPFAGEAKVSVDTAMQSQLDSLRLLSLEQTQPNIFPFNPNYISDYKGYTLGMSAQELDRLFAFRKAGKFINSAGEFQEVTQISDSLLASISPYFAFPEWPKKRRGNGSTMQLKNERTKENGVIDLNQATAE